VQLRRLQQVSLDARYDMSAIDGDAAQAIHGAIERYYRALNGRLDTGPDMPTSTEVPDFHGRRLLHFPLTAELVTMAEVAVQRYRDYEANEGPALAAV
jgi:hypothetical protein